MKTFLEWLDSKFNENFMHYGGPINPLLDVKDSGGHFVVVVRFGIKEDEERMMPELPDAYTLPTWMKNYTTKNTSKSNGGVRVYEIEAKLPKSLTIGDTEPGKNGYGPKGWSTMGYEENPVDEHYLEAYFSKFFDFDNSGDNPFGRTPKNWKNGGSSDWGAQPY